MTLKEAYDLGKKKLLESGVADADLDAWYLLEFVSGITRASYYADPGRQLDDKEEKRYIEVLEKRAARIPIQHITGVQEFMGLEFAVNEHVLIPRQDTETLVEYLLEKAEPGMRVLDLCTGSGCILLSLLKLGENLSGIGSDISAEALRTAEENKRHLDIEAEFIQSDLFENIEERFDIIASNPPYIPTGKIEELEAEVKEHDPITALDGKEDGLWFYRKIIEASPDYLTEGGRLCLEIGYDQGDDVASIMRERGFLQVEIKKDLAMLDRVVSGVYNRTVSEK